MSGHMQLSLDDTILKYLKALKGNVLKKQTYNPTPGGAGGTIFLKFNDICLSLKNDYDYREDGEEYPTLRICLSDGVPKFNKEQYEEKVINRILVGITIIRDHVEWLWNGNYWIMENDIGIKFTFEDKEIIYAVEDCMAKTFEIIETDAGAEKIALNDLFFELWTFKENVLKKFERTEIPL